jgi:uncharacterized protein (TIGR03067 family)
MRVLMTVAAVLVVCVLAASPLAADDKKDQEALQGTWSVVKAIRGGKPKDDIKDDKLVFQGNKAIVKTSGGREETATFTIDSSKTPKNIDIMPDGGGEKKVLGIYKVEGGNLELCFSEKERPKEFGSPEGSLTFYIVLKRDK